MKELPRRVSLDCEFKKWFSIQEFVWKKFIFKKRKRRRRMADKNKSEEYYIRPEKLGAWAGFKQFLWNPSTSQFMGRTSSSWGKWSNPCISQPLQYCLVEKKKMKARTEEKVWKVCPWLKKNFYQTFGAHQVSESLVARVDKAESLHKWKLLNIFISMTLKHLHSPRAFLII